MKIPFFAINKKIRFEQLVNIVDFLDSRRKPVKEDDRIEGDYPYYGSTGYIGTINDFIFDEQILLLSEDGGYFRDPIKPISFIVDEKCWVNNHAHVLKIKQKFMGEISFNYLDCILSNYDLEKFLTGSTRDKLTKEDAKEIPIPIIELQEKNLFHIKLDISNE